MNAARNPVGKVLRTPKTAELIANHLRGQIVRGELAPDESLPSEVELMEQFGVSRPTMREAYRILETERLISVRRGAQGGARVTAPDIAVAARYVGLILQLQGTTIDEVYEARRVTEASCVRRLAANRTKADLAALETVLEDFRTLLAAGDDHVTDPAAWSEATYRFHEQLLERAGNRALALQGRVLQDILATHMHITVSKTYRKDQASARFKKMIRSCEKLVALVVERDADAAEKHWMNHLQVSESFMLAGAHANRSVVDLFS